MAQAQAVSVPSGVNPAAAIPAGTDVVQHSRSGLPPATSQEPGFVANPQGVPSMPAEGSPAAGVDPDYAAFMEWKKAQATATPVAKAPTAEPTPPAPTPPAPTTYVGADKALELTHNAAASDPYLRTVFGTFEVAAPNLNLHRALGNAIDRGDPDLVDVAYIREAGGANASKLVELAKSMVEHTATRVTEITNQIHQTAGGKAQFDAAVAAFNKQAPQYLKEFVASGYDSLDPAKIKGATEAIVDFVSSKGILPTAPQGHISAGGGAPAAQQAMTKEQFQAERLRLDRNARDFADRERELTARRQLGKRMGI